MTGLIMLWYYIITDWLFFFKFILIPNWLTYTLLILNYTSSRLSIENARREAVSRGSWFPGGLWEVGLILHLAKWSLKLPPPQKKKKEAKAEFLGTNCTSLINILPASPFNVFLWIRLPNNSYLILALRQQQMSTHFGWNLTSANWYSITGRQALWAHNSDQTPRSSPSLLAGLF